MRDRSRREFMGLAAASAASLFARPLDSAQAQSRASLGAIDPDLVVYNAKVFTIDSALPRAGGFAIAGSRFVAIGSSADMRALVGKTTQTFDAKGMTIVPGFTDTHNH